MGGAPDDGEADTSVSRRCIKGSYPTAFAGVSDVGGRAGPDGAARSAFGSSFAQRAARCRRDLEFVERAAENPGQMVDRKAAETQMAAFGPAFSLIPCRVDSPKSSHPGPDLETGS